MAIARSSPLAEVESRVGGTSSSEWIEAFRTCIARLFITSVVKFNFERHFGTPYHTHLSSLCQFDASSRGRLDGQCPCILTAFMAKMMTAGELTRSTVHPPLNLHSLSALLSGFYVPQACHAAMTKSHSCILAVSSEDNVDVHSL